MVFQNKGEKNIIECENESERSENMQKGWVLIYLIIGLILLNYANKSKSSQGNRVMLGVMGMLFVFFALISYTG